MIRKSKKQALKNLLNLIQYDTRSIAGSNLREIMLLTDKNDVSELCKEDASQITYKEVPVEEKWRVSSLKELIDVKSGRSELGGFTEKEIDHMINFVSSN